MSITNSIFKRNFAFEEGGSIKWIGNSPLWNKILFLNNNAIYGNEFASNPIRMRFVISGKDNFTAKKKKIL